MSTNRIVLTIPWIALLAVCVACGPARNSAGATQSRAPDPQGMGEGRTQVMLDIFSGRPSPSWVLSPQEAAEWDQLLQALPEGVTDGEVHGGLGYRGFIVTRLAGVEDGCESVTVYRTTVTMGEQCAAPALEDATRSLERFLLRTSRAHIDEDLVRQLEVELESGSARSGPIVQVRSSMDAQSVSKGAQQ